MQGELVQLAELVKEWVHGVLDDQDILDPFPEQGSCVVPFHLVSFLDA